MRALGGLLTDARVRAMAQGHNSVHLNLGSGAHGSDPR